MTRKRWLAVVAVAMVLCLVGAGLATALLARTVPAVSRLLRGDTPAPTAIPIGGRSFADLLPIATLTALPTRVPTAVPPTLTSTPAPTPTTAPEVTPPLPGPTPETISATRTVTPTAAAATATPPPQWIAFESKRGKNGDYEIVVTTPSGTRTTNLTNSWADDVAPAWARGAGSKWQLAFVSFRDTLTGKWGLANGSIYAMEFDPVKGTAGEVWRVTDGEGADGWPTWSPDGRRLAFQSDRSGNWDIWIVNADGSGLTQLTFDPADDRYADWSPDGKRIAFTSSRGGNEDVWVLDVAATLSSGDDSLAINLTNSPGRDRYPMWSRDGRQLTFNTKRDGNLEVYVMKADGSGQRNLSRSPKSTEGLADWSPDDKRLVLYSDRSGNKEVYVLDLATERWTNISNHPASDEFCAWSP